MTTLVMALLAGGTMLLLVVGVSRRWPLDHPNRERMSVVAFLAIVLSCMWFGHRVAGEVAQYLQLPVLYVPAAEVTPPCTLYIGKHRTYDTMTIGTSASGPESTLFALQITVDSVIARPLAGGTCFVWVVAARTRRPLNGIRLQNGDLISGGSLAGGHDVVVRDGGIFWGGTELTRQSRQPVGLAFRRVEGEWYLRGAAVLNGDAKVIRAGSPVRAPGSLILRDGESLQWVGDGNQGELAVKHKGGKVYLSIKGIGPVPLKSPNEEGGAPRFIVADRYVDGYDDLVVLDGIRVGSRQRRLLATLSIESDTARIHGRDVIYASGAKPSGQYYNHPFTLVTIPSLNEKGLVDIKGIVASSTDKQRVDFQWMLVLALASPLFLLLQTMPAEGPGESATRIVRSPWGVVVFGALWLVLLVRLILGIRVRVAEPYQQDGIVFSLLLLLFIPIVVYMATTVTNRGGIPVWRYGRHSNGNVPVLAAYALYVATFVTLYIPLTQQTVVLMGAALGVAVMAGIVRNGSFYSIMNSWRWRAVVIVPLVALAAVMGGEVIWTPFAGFGIRSSQFIQLAFVLWLYAVSAAWRPQGGVRQVAKISLLALVVVLWIALCAYVSGDNGIFIYVLPALLILPVIEFRHYVARKGLGRGWWRALIVPMGFVLTMVAMILAIQWVVNEVVTEFPESRIAGVLEDKFKAGRLLPLDQLARLPARASRQDYESLVSLRDYAMAGAEQPRGYFGSPITAEMRSIAVTDKLFAVLLIAEHGRWAGMLLFLLFLALLVAGAIALSFDSVLGGKTAIDEHIGHRTATGLVALLTLACAAIWIMGANIGALSFVGKNIPLLGLNSGMDVVYGLVLVALVFAPLHAVSQRREEYRDSDGRRVTAGAERGAMLLAASILAALSIYTIVPGLLKLASSPDSPARRMITGYPKLVNDLFSDGTLQMTRRGGQPYVVYTPSSRWGKMVERSGLISDVERFNQNPKGYNIFREEPNAGFGGRPNWFDWRYATIRNPLTPQRQFRGVVRFAGDTTAFGVYGSGIEWGFRPHNDLVLRASTPQIDLGWRLSAFNLGHDLVLDIGVRWFERQPRRGLVMINGVAYNPGGRPNRVRLAPGDIIDYIDDRGRACSVTYRAADGGRIFIDRWVNGGVRPIYTAGADFYLARPIRSAILDHVDFLQRYRGQRGTRLDSLQKVDVALTIDPQLQRLVQEHLNRVCATEPTDLSQELRSVLQASVCIMDCMTGEVLALGSYPTWDPNGPSIPVSLADNIEERMTVNQNFVAYEMASAGKPLLAVAALTAHPDLAGLTIPREPGGRNPAREYERLFDIPIPTSRSIDERGRLYQPTRPGGQVPFIDFTRFMTVSDNLYNLMFNTLALLPPQPVSYHGPGTSEQYYNLDHTATFHDRAPAFEPDEFIGLRHPSAGGQAELNDLQATAWGMALHRLTDIPTEVDQVPPLTTDSTFWRGGELLFQRSVVNAPTPLYPQPKAMPLSTTRDFRGEWISFLYGGRFRLSNVHIAAAYSRILTGKRVRARIIKAVNGRPIFDPLGPVYDVHPDAPPSDAANRVLFDAACRHVRQAAHWVIAQQGGGGISRGTGASQYPILRDLGFDNSGHFYFGKTGTLRVTSRGRRRGHSGSDENSTLWIGVYGRGSLDRPEKAVCMVVYARARGIGFALNRIANPLLPSVLTRMERAHWTASTIISDGTPPSAAPVVQRKWNH